MTLFCPLNQPQCKRSIMTSNGPLVKQECPISAGRKCAFAPTVCPMYPQDDECFLKKVQEVTREGGCKAKPRSVAGQCCKTLVKTSSRNKTVGKSYPPPNCAELPPCTRCSFGHTDSIGELAKRKKQKDTRDERPRSRKDEDVKVASSRKDLSSRTNLLESASNPKLSKKTSEIKVNAGKAEKTKTDITDSAKREEIFKNAIADKVAKLQSREHLVVPQCNTASRRPLPCAGCLVELLSPPQPNDSPATNHVYKTESQAALEERCHVERLMANCPALRIPSVCPNQCSCPDIPLLEEEEEDGVCPYVLMTSPGKRKPSKIGSQCPLTRLPAHRLILDLANVPDRGEDFDACKCPLIPNNCCYSLPGCPVHTMKVLCPRFSNN